jgi:hypothetical protein
MVYPAIQISVRVLFFFLLFMQRNYSCCSLKLLFSNLRNSINRYGVSGNSNFCKGFFFFFLFMQINYSCCSLKLLFSNLRNSINRYGVSDNSNFCKGFVCFFCCSCKEITLVAV